MSFAGKVVIITGASSGIGAATAIKFAEQKAKVVIAARTESKLSKVVEQCKKYCITPLIIVADITKEIDIENIVNTTIAEYGKIDILVNNAGIAGTASIWDENAMEVYDHLMTTNLRSAVYLTHLASTHLIKSKGNIVNISSVASVDPFSPANFAYCVSKAGIDHFSRAIALELGPKGVRVNTVNPGPVQTNFADNLPLSDDSRDSFLDTIKKTTVLNRVSQPEEVADLILYLASNKAKAITGSSVFADNGILLKRDVKLVD